MTVFGQWPLWFPTNPHHHHSPPPLLEHEPPPLTAMLRGPSPLRQEGDPSWASSARNLALRGLQVRSTALVEMFAEMFGPAWVIARFMHANRFVFGLLFFSIFLPADTSGTLSGSWERERVPSAPSETACY